jgi:PPOX class probable FMN-dependent enzyme
MSSEHDIRSVDELRAIVGEPSPVTPVKILPALDSYMQEFIRRSPFLVLATADADGRQDASPKGDQPGFVRIEDERTLVVPERNGNRLVMSLQNVLANPHVSLLFVIPGTPETLRVNGTARLTRDPELCAQLAARGKPALLAMRVAVDECFFHCAKAFLRSSLWKPETWPERQRLSFGKMLAPRIGADDSVAQLIDQAVEEDYRTNL